MLRRKKLRKFLSYLKCEKGVSLIEVVIVIVILGISVIPLSKLVIKNQQSLADYVLLTQAEFFCQSCMEEFIGYYTAEDAGYGYDWVVANVNGAIRSHPSMPWSAQADIDLMTLDDVNYAVLTVTVATGDAIPDVSLETWMVDSTW